MNDQDRNKSILPLPGIGVLVLITFFLVFFIGIVITLLVDSKFSLFSEILIIFPAVIFILAQKRPFFQSFRLKTIPLSLVAYSFFISLGAFILGDELDRIINMFFPLPTSIRLSLESLLTINSLSDAVIIIVSAVIFAGVAEEMLFRGIVQRSLEHHKDPAQAIVLTAVVFAIIHINPWTAIQITFLGLVLGYMAWKAGSILPAIILHAVNNLLSVILINLPEDIVQQYAQDHVRLHWIAAAVLVLFVTFPAYLKQCNVRRNHQT